MIRSRIFALPIFRVLIENERERLDHFLDRLMELRFGRVLGLHLGHQLCNVISHGNASPNAQALDVSVREAKIESKIYGGPPKVRKGAKETGIARLASSRIRRMELCQRCGCA